MRYPCTDRRCLSRGRRTIRIFFRDEIGVWLVGVAAGACLGGLGAPVQSLAGSAKGMWVRGSAMRLALIPAVFVTKYATQVLFAIRPESMRAASVRLGVGLLDGFFSGVFLGRLLPVLCQYRFLRACRVAGV